MAFKTWTGLLCITLTCSKWSMWTIDKMVFKPHLIPLAYKTVLKDYKTWQGAFTESTQVWLETRRLTHFASKYLLSIRSLYTPTDSIRYFQTVDRFSCRRGIILSVYNQYRSLVNQYNSLHSTFLGVYLTRQ